MIPIWFTIWMILSFTWFGYESDWMRIRLLVGALTKAIDLDTWCSTWHIYPERFQPYQFPPQPTCAMPSSVRVGAYRENGHHGIYRLNSNDAYGSDSMLFSPGIIEPICGWEWLESKEHPLVEYIIEITAWGVHYKITLLPNTTKPNLMKDICRIALKPTKTQRQEIRVYNKAKREVAKI